MSKLLPAEGAGGAAISCGLCHNFTFRLKAWCGGHVDLECSRCGQLIHHGDFLMEHTMKVHKPGVTCPECSPDFAALPVVNDKQQ